MRKVMRKDKRRKYELKKKKKFLVYHLKSAVGKNPNGNTYKYALNHLKTLPSRFVELWYIAL
jgi:hypothetical protein